MKHKKLQTTPEISKRMSKVKLKSGDAETMLAKALWHEGLRYRKNFKALPGSPDIAITKHKIAIFVDGEFWHGCDWENKKLKLKSNKEYWVEKIEENMSRDNNNDYKLNGMGWTPIHFWEKEIKEDLPGCVSVVFESIENPIVD